MTNQDYYRPSYRSCVAVRWTAVGAAFLGVSGLIFGAGSATYGYGAEATWCFTFGTGFLLFGVALAGWVEKRGATSSIGLVLASIGGGAWAFDAVSRGHLPHLWALVGTGVILAAISAILLLALQGRHRGISWLFPIAFGVMLIASVEVMWKELAFSIWFLADVFLFAGAALLTFRSGPEFQARLFGTR